MEAFAPAALVPEGVDPAAVTFELPGRVAQLAPLEAMPVRAGAAYLRLSLPETTPPGSYEGTARLGKNEFRVVAEVEPAPSLQITPTHLSLEAEPGAELEVHANALNDGNVPLEIRRTYAFGVFADEGIEEAFGAAFQAETATGERRFDRFVETLADHHGGLVRVQVAEGDGVLEPGDLRQLRLSLHLPTELEAGRTYAGTWSLPGLNYYVQAVVAPTPARTTRRRKAG
jgi:hypothetical protein